MNDSLPIDVWYSTAANYGEADEIEFMPRTSARAERYLRARLAGIRFEDDPRSTTRPGSTLQRLALPFASYCGTAAARLLEV